MAASVVGWIVAHVFATFTTRGWPHAHHLCAALVVSSTTG